MMFASMNKMPMPPGVKKGKEYDSDSTPTSTPKVKQPSRVAIMGGVLAKALKNKSLKK